MRGVCKCAALTPGATASVLHAPQAARSLRARAHSQASAGELWWSPLPEVAGGNMCVQAHEPTQQ